jgi:hypothetical protein
MLFQSFRTFCAITTLTRNAILGGVGDQDHAQMVAVVGLALTATAAAFTTLTLDRLARRL